MNVNRPFLAALIAAVLQPATLWADDTPSNMGPSDSRPTATADPLRAARDAIAAQQWPKALEQLRAQQPSMNRSADLQNLLGFVYRKQAHPDLDKAFEHYRLALEINPGHRGTHEYIGEAYLMRKQPAKAGEHLEALKRLCGGSTCEEYQDLAKALAAYRD